MSDETRTKMRRESPTNFEKVTAKLRSAAADAVTVLYASLFDSSAAVRIRAAEAILNLGAISETALELQRRVSELERVKWKK